MGIRERREALGLKQTELAAAVRETAPRIDAAMISRFEHGVCLPPAKTLAALASALHCTQADLLAPDDISLVNELEGAAELSEGADAAVRNIPYGRENAVSRQSLCMRLGVGDRLARKAVEQARRAGYIIVNDGTGYYRTDDLPAIERQYITDRRRALSVLYRLKTLRRILKEAGRDV